MNFQKRIGSVGLRARYKPLAPPRSSDWSEGAKSLDPRIAGGERTSAVKIRPLAPTILGSWDVLNGRLTAPRCLASLAAAGDGLAHKQSAAPSNLESMTRSLPIHTFQDPLLPLLILVS